jgi:hypothetical protein
MAKMPPSSPGVNAKDDPVMIRVRSIPTQMFGDKHGRNTRKYVMMLIASYANPDGSRCFPGVSQLAKDCGLRKRSIQKVISWLCDHGFLAIDPNAGPKLTNVYTILPPEVVNEQHSSSCPEVQGVVNGGAKISSTVHPTLQLPINYLSVDLSVIPPPRKKIARKRLIAGGGFLRRASLRRPIRDLPISKIPFPGTTGNRW